MTQNKTQKKLLFLSTIILSLLFLSISLVSAERVTPYFDLYKETVQNEIYAGDAAEFTITLENKQDFEETFFLSMPDVRWSPQTTPVFYFTSGMNVNPTSNVTAVLYIKSHADVTPGTHYVELIAKSEITGKRLRKVLTIKILEKPLIFDTDVELITDFPEMIEVERLYSTKVTLKNNNPKKFSNVDLILSSNLISSETSFPLGPNEAKTIEFTFNIPVDTLSQVETVSTQLFYDDELIKSYQNQFQVIEKEYDIEQTIQAKKGFFSKTEFIRVFNPNNKERIVLVKYEQTSPELFTKYNYMTNVPKEGKTIGWELVIPANGEKIIEIKQNYSSIFFLVIILIISLGAIFYTRAPVQINKKILSSHFDNDSIYKVKIQLTIKNKSKKLLENVGITDVLPYLGTIEKQHTIGIIPPDKTIRYNEETYLKWKLDAVEPKEERILAYTMNLKLSIIGSFILKPALVKINNKKFASNKITINDGSR